MLVLSFEIPAHEEAIDLLLRGVARVRTSERARITTRPPRASDAGFALVDVVVPESPRVYQALLWVLCEINAWCSKQWQIPSVLDGGIVFEDEPPGVEWWRCNAALHARGAGDCEDIACARVGEWVAAGVRAGPLLELESETATHRQFHVVVLVENPMGGLVREDPTREIEAKSWGSELFW